MDEGGLTWVITIGDSAMAWAKAIGKLCASPRRDVRRLVLDFSQIRGPGNRLKGYGWVCNGWEPLHKAMVAIVEILNRYAGQLLPEIAIGDIINWIGTILSSRRSAEALLMDGWNPALEEFKNLKREYWKHNPQRNQSNNSVIYWKQPSVSELEGLLTYADACGGDPGIVNGEAAVRRCPWFVGFNPCFEIMLASKGFCNLVTLCVPAFKGNFAALSEAVYYMARANYRQTAVNLNDALLQPSWHQTNEALRLCGVSLTGLEQATWLSDYQIRQLRNQSVAGAYGMADEWGMPHPKAVTTLKPEGTSSKAFDCTEGIHRPGAKWIFNWVNYPKDSDIVETFKLAGYKTLPNGLNTLICHPVEYDGVKFDTVNGLVVNNESAVSQLQRYRRWNTLWADHNVSATISYEPREIPEIARWVHDNWDRGYIATAFLRRIDPTMKPEDVGHPYLPQQTVTEATFREYESTLRPVNLDTYQGEQIDPDAEGNCKGGVCGIN
jgi:ribonucleoside-triphosphate reductase